jgi:hypothetical protein
MADGDGAHDGAARPEDMGALMDKLVEDVARKIGLIDFSGAKITVGTVDIHEYRLFAALPAEHAAPFERLIKKAIEDFQTAVKAQGHHTAGEWRGGVDEKKR